ncbi:hypothetical protein BDV26DRAFT_155474 [Aspergillus bertholletiae]|uniref:Uncharacterized protein n=1 Tax=Aspergillus bertholletiae TaxID=1226010 RepID=A0A5N7BDQ4_9EURO|nr:hypothetical protein BDV26DRAFT_155474 [Aspergillus bertholletiae]
MQELIIGFQVHVRIPLSPRPSLFHSVFLFCFFFVFLFLGSYLPSCIHTLNSITP